MTFFIMNYVSLLCPGNHVCRAVNICKLVAVDSSTLAIYKFVDILQYTHAVVVV